MPAPVTQPLFKSPYLSRQEAAAYLRVCVNTVDNLIQRGVLTPHRVRSTRKVLLRKDDVRDLVVDASRPAHLRERS